MSQTKTYKIEDFSIQEWASIIQTELNQLGNNSFHAAYKHLDRKPNSHIEDDNSSHRFDPYRDTSFTPQTKSKPLLLDEGRYKGEYLRDVEISYIIVRHLESLNHKEGEEIALNHADPSKESFFNQFKPQPIEERLCEHRNIFELAEYALAVKDNPTDADCMIAAIAAYSEVDLDMMFPGDDQFGLDIGAAFHDVARCLAHGKRKKFVEIGKKSIQECKEFMQFATMYNIRLAILPYWDDIKVGFARTRETHEELFLPESSKKITCIASSGTTREKARDQITAEERASGK